MARHHVSVVLVALAFALVGCGEDGSTSSPTTSSPTTSSAAEPVETPTLAVGDTADAGDWSVTLHGVTDPWVDPEMGGGEAGTRFLVADVSLENSTDAPATVSGGCFDLRDTDGRSHSWTIVGDNESPDGEAAPGEQLRGDVGFQLPEDVVASTLKFTCGWRSASFTLTDATDAAPATTTTQSTSAPPETADDSGVDSRLVDVADQIGCGKPTVEEGPDGQGVEQYAVCGLDGSRVQLYAISDRPAVEKAAKAYVDLDETSVWKGDDVMITPDDQSQLEQIRTAIG